MTPHSSGKSPLKLRLLLAGAALSVTESRRADGGAEEPGGVAGSTVAGGDHAVTRSAVDAVRSRADAQPSGRRLGGQVAQE
jgi:hypothetical protein